MKRLSNRFFTGLATFACCVGATAQNPNAGTDPIAFTAHGGLFGPDGRQLRPTVESVRAAQRHYLAALQAAATPSQRAQATQKRALLVQLAQGDAQTELYATSLLIDWLIDAVKPDNAADIANKNSLLRDRLAWRLPASAAPAGKVRPVAYAPGDHLLAMLAQAELTLPVPAAAPAVPPFALLQSREAYQKTCIKNGVPVPPNWGAAGWKEAGVVGAPFIENPQKAGLWYFKGTAPAGICLGLPRYDNVANPTTKLFGIICMGEKKIKDANAEDRVGACFWDWDDKPNPIPLTGQKVPLTNFAAGAELGLGGICSDCHAGENAFVVHPDDATFAKFDGVTLPSLDAKAWYLPIGLKAAWPKNLFPTTTEAKLGEAKLDQKTEGSCLSCHRLPEISKPDAKIKDYCSTVLSQAVQGGTDNGTVIRKTMPPLDAAGMADTLDYSQHIGKLNDLCKAAMGVGFLPP